MVGWHQQLNGHEFEQAPGHGDRDREAWCAAVHGDTKSRTRLRGQQQQQCIIHNLSIILHVIHSFLSS